MTVVYVYKLAGWLCGCFDVPVFHPAFTRPMSSTPAGKMVVSKHHYMQGAYTG